ncbi:MAG: glutathione S-transferase N-terminal domain-containing protein [Nanoarchaeota archaeon]|nr:glutathione S-transferase N-terminal domain-containing protein [Nanoarchaeota archaeon]
MKVKVYSTDTCPYCTIAKNFLKKHKIEFKEVNVANDMSARQEMFNKSGQMGVPVIDIDGIIVIGFDQQALKRILKIKD